MPTFTLRVSGNASMPKTAEQANLRISSSSSGSNKQAVSDEVLTTASHVENMIQTLLTSSGSSSVSHWSHTGLSTGSWTERVPQHLAEGQDVVAGSANTARVDSSSKGGDPNKSVITVLVRRYNARIEFDIRFRDFAMLSQFSSQLASLDHCEILSLTWVLLPATQEQYKSQLRTTAAGDARAKVRDYCQIVCPGEDVVIVPTELGSENVEGGLFSSAGMDEEDEGIDLSYSATASTRKGVGLSFTPQEINMTLSVDFVFKVETNGFKLSKITTEADQHKVGSKRSRGAGDAALVDLSQQE